MVKCGDLDFRTWFALKFLPQSQIAAEHKIACIRADLDQLREQKTKVLEDIQQTNSSIALMMDDTVPFKPSSTIDKEQSIQQSKHHLMLCRQKIKRFDGLIQFFEKTLHVIESRQMAGEMQGYVRSLQTHLHGTKTDFNLDDLENAMDDIADANDELQEFDLGMDMCMKSAWTMDMDKEQGVMNALLSDELPMKTTVPERKRVMYPV